MPCPNCGHKSAVLDSRLKKTGRTKKHVYVWRRRVCLKKGCTLRWSTVEGQESTARQASSGPTSIVDQAAYDLAAQMLTKLASDMRRVKTRRKLRAFKRGLPKWMREQKK